MAVNEISGQQTDCIVSCHFWGCRGERVRPDSMWGFTTSRLDSKIVSNLDAQVASRAYMRSQFSRAGACLYDGSSA
ncbi:hypothetical protein CBM2585_A10048 [Cupriavidus taiwanensis]|nr:hypothetical protein CBM2585_A10048 [Cupriavidus taiwanensis]